MKIKTAQSLSRTSVSKSDDVEDKIMWCSLRAMLDSLDLPVPKISIFEN